MNGKVLFAVACLVVVVVFDVFVVLQAWELSERPTMKSSPVLVVNATSGGNVDGFDLREPWTYSEWFKVYKPELRQREDWLAERNVSG